MARSDDAELAAEQIATEGTDDQGFDPSAFADFHAQEHGDAPPPGATDDTQATASTPDAAVSPDASSGTPDAGSMQALHDTIHSDDPNVGIPPEILDFHSQLHPEGLPPSATEPADPNATIDAGTSKDAPFALPGGPQPPKSISPDSFPEDITPTADPAGAFPSAGVGKTDPFALPGGPQPPASISPDSFPLPVPSDPAGAFPSAGTVTPPLPAFVQPPGPIDAPSGPVIGSTQTPSEAFKSAEVAAPLPTMNSGALPSPQPFQPLAPRTTLPPGPTPMQPLQPRQPFSGIFQPGGQFGNFQPQATPPTMAPIPAPDQPSYTPPPQASLGPIPGSTQPNPATYGGGFSQPSTFGNAPITQYDRQSLTPAGGIGVDGSDFSPSGKAPFSNAEGDSIQANTGEGTGTAQAIPKIPAGVLDNMSLQAQNNKSQLSSGPQFKSPQRQGGEGPNPAHDYIHTLLHAGITDGIHPDYVAAHNAAHGNK